MDIRKEMRDMIVPKTNPITIIIEARREEYTIAAARKNTLKIADLITTLEEYAEDYGDDALVVLSHDNGYTYGGIREGLIRVEEQEEEE